ncbi:DUF1822 family protein [Oscillatoria sp. FACHB-1406]|uniref:DUF1822 family protein n=1 Tax=Oscillatoria sp. FACHB-1406 TaxID=2692846 RepID=UPI0016885C6F|nr:DUF1822 family protein [Oscillatoria sp. FACHB-1406]MBD2578367.1 DUF1822 family protein [Oscillatoria sp. FACHB-1406]
MLAPLLFWLNIMTNSAQNPEITAPLTLTVHQTAKALFDQYQHPKKAQKVYLNALAVGAVDYYLSCLGIKTAKPTPELNTMVDAAFTDSAVLNIASSGKIECRPLLPEETECFIPLEVRDNRLGYVAVRLNAELTEAALVGFLSPQKLAELPLQERIDLEEFDPVDNLFDALEPEPISATQRLHNFAEELLALGWKKLAELVTIPASEPAFSVRSPTTLPKSPLLNESYSGIKLGKVLDFENDCHVVLAIGIRPAENEEVEVNLDFLPEEKKPYLPPDLQVSILDEQNEVVMYKKTKQRHKNFPFQFFGEAGDSFRIRVVFGDRSTLESFYL